MWRIGNPCASGGMEADTATVEEQYGGSKKKKVELYDPAIPPLGIYLERLKTLCWDICTPPPPCF